MSGQVIYLQGLKSPKSRSENPELKAALEKFVFGVYRDLLKRNPSAQEMRTHVADMFAGQTRRDIALILLRSEEAQKGFNQEMFQQFLQVNPTVAEQKYWTHIADSTKNRQDVLAGFLSSDRFVETTGESHGEYVNGLFSSLFQREATVIELNHWVALLNSQTVTRFTVAHGILNEKEFRDQWAMKWHERLLGRQADELALDFSLEQLINGESHEEVIAEIISSRDYFTHVIMKYCFHETSPLI